MPEYDFKTLSPIDFELLVRDLLNAEYGLNLVSFATGPDGGIDLWDRERKVIVQCKHMPDAKRAQLIKAANGEVSKALPTDTARYIFAVSATVSPAAECAVTEALEDLPAEVVHRGALNALLAAHPDIEKRHFKLWLSSTVALQRMLSNAQWQQSEELLQQIYRRARLFVHTADYERVTKLLFDSNVAIISGAPGVGKSTLAEMILLSLSRDNWKIINIRSDISEAYQYSKNPDENVIFFYDDFLGQTSRAESTGNAGASLNILIESLRNGDGDRLLLMTSRQQILNQAFHGSDDRLRRLKRAEAEVRVELSGLSRIEKAKMLFNHLHFGVEDREIRSGLSEDRRYRKVVAHSGFNPRLLQSVILLQQNTSVDSLYQSLFEALDHPDEVWAGSFEQLSSLAVDILLRLAVSPRATLQMAVLREELDVEPRQWNQALKILEDTWVTLIDGREGVTAVSLYDPSRKDFLVDLVSETGYLNRVVRLVNRPTQIEYLLLLSEEGAGGARDLDGTFQKQIRSSISRSSAEFTAALRRLTVRSTEALRDGFVWETPGGTASWRKRTGVDWREGRRILSVFFDESALIAKVHLSPLVSTRLFDEDFDRLAGICAELATSGLGVDAESVFRFVAEISVHPILKANTGTLDALTDFGLDSVEDVADLEAYLKLPSWYVEERGEADSSVLGEAIRAQVENMLAESDRDVLVQMYEEVAGVADALGLDVDFEEIEERIDHLGVGSDELESYRPSNYLNTSEASGLPGATEEAKIDEMFAKLRR